MNIYPTIQVVPYDSNWPKLFDIEAEKIKRALGDNCITIHHIGSTSVPGLASKPIIDIIPVVKDILSLNTRALESEGYLSRGEFGMPFRRFFQKGLTIRTHNLHVWEEHYPEIQKHLLFRDFLKNHSTEREQYALLKCNLAKKFQNNPLLYANSKIPLINEIIQKSGFNDYLFVQALTSNQWDTYHRLRKNHSFNPQDAAHDHPNKSHFHFILNKGNTIIGASQIRFTGIDNAFIKFISLDTAYKNQKHETKFFTLIERWIQHQNRLLVHQT